MIQVNPRCCKCEVITYCLKVCASMEVSRPLVVCGHLDAPLVGGANSLEVGEQRGTFLPSGPVVRSYTNEPVCLLQFPRSKPCTSSRILQLLDVTLYWMSARTDKSLQNSARITFRRISTYTGIGLCVSCWRPEAKSFWRECKCEEVFGRFNAYECRGILWVQLLCASYAASAVLQYA